MGYGNYSQSAHAALVAGRAAQSESEVFAQRGCHPLMNPRDLKMRESRDSPDHPDSLGIVFALDVTGSMGDIPRTLARRDLPKFMKTLGACGIPDPQLLFMAIGDAVTDHAPLQVGQFESTADLIDRWLTWSYLEGGGGGNGAESYELAFYMLAQHMDMDCWVKRRKRGYLFMTGDDKPFPAVSRHQIESLIGEKLDEDLPIEEVIAAAAETFHLFFLIPDLKRRGYAEPRWRELLGDQVICMESPDDTCAVAAAIVGLTEGALKSIEDVPAALAQGDVPADRTGAVMRALRPYAEVLHPDHAALHRAAMAATTAPRAWWRKLFG